MPIIGLTHQHNNTKEDAYTYLQSHANFITYTIKKYLYTFFTFSCVEL